MNAFIFELLSPLNLVWAALLAGFIVYGIDGRLYRTEAGDAYLNKLLEIQNGRS